MLKKSERVTKTKKRKRSIEDRKIKEGGKNGPAQSFPTLQLQINVLV